MLYLVKEGCAKRNANATKSKRAKPLPERVKKKEGLFLRLQVVMSAIAMLLILLENDKLHFDSSILEE
jgi:hypothetical protein